MTNPNVKAQFVAAHPEFATERVDATWSRVTHYLAQKKLPLTLANCNSAWVDILAALEALESKPEPSPAGMTPEEIESCAAVIEGWSSSTMREHMKDPELAAATEYVLSQKKKLDKTKAKSQVQPKVEPKPKPPVKPAEEIAIERMNSSEFKKALLDPVKARGIERVLEVAARRSNQ